MQDDQLKRLYTDLLENRLNVKRAVLAFLKKPDPAAKKTSLTLIVFWLTIGFFIAGFIVFFATLANL